MRSLVEASLQNDEAMKELHDAVEQDLVKMVCSWSHGVVVYGAGGAALILYLTGQENYINPLLVSLFGLCASLFSQKVQPTASMCFIAILIVKHALSQGCSASLVPAIYGFLPCAFGFIYRSDRAIVLSTVGVLLATFIIFAVDLSGNCSSEPIRYE